MSYPPPLFSLSAIKIDFLADRTVFYYVYTLQILAIQRYHLALQIIYLYLRQML